MKTRSPFPFPLKRLQQRATQGALALGAMIAACSSPDRPATTTTATSPSAEELSPAARLEAALGDVDTGKNVEGAKDTLGQLLLGGLSQDERGRAKLGLSRIAELQGDREGAIRLAEEAVVDSAPGASKRLYELLGGKPVPDRPAEQDIVIAPVARALSAFYEPIEGNKATVRVHIFGAGRSNQRLGTFAIDAALREHAEARCPSCDTSLLHIDSMTNGQSSWTEIPRMAPELGSSLVVTYMDLESLIPSRYDAHLAAPSAEIEARLRRGEGVVAVRTREGAPPLVTIAAPRYGQLAQVEERFAAMQALPKGLLAVPVKADLTSSEIRNTVRSSFGAMLACYQALEARRGRVEGEAVARFAILANGEIEGLKLDVGPQLDEPEFRSCTTAAWRALQFPATGVRRTTVTYPVQLTAGDD